MSVYSNVRTTKLKLKDLLPLKQGIDSSHFHRLLCFWRVYEVLWLIGRLDGWLYYSSINFVFIRFSTSALASEKKRKRKHAASKVDEDAVKHGGWWRVKEFQEITGPIAIEVFPFSYILAKDDGTFTFGAPHNEGQLYLYDLK